MINNSNYKINQLSDKLKAGHKFTGSIVERSYDLFGDEWANEFEKVLVALFPTDEAMMKAAKGYAAFAMQSMRLQAIFEKDRKYKLKSHEEASIEVYFNESYMMEEYLPGLLISHFLWPHHYRQIQFFKSSFLQPMRVANAKSFVEVGVGTGLYSSILLRSLPQIKGLGLDISPFSQRFTQAQLAAFGVSDRYKLYLRDITTESIEPQGEWLVCVEVLEHLDDPITFLRALRRNLAPGSKAFITAALNAAHTDHIYLYRSSDEVLKHLVEAGFTLEQSFVGQAYKASALNIPVPEAAAFVVY